jgi:hypothetical protein
MLACASCVAAGGRRRSVRVRRRWKRLTYWTVTITLRCENEGQARQSAIRLRWVRRAGSAKARPTRRATAPDYGLSALLTSRSAG